MTWSEVPQTPQQPPEQPGAHLTPTKNRRRNGCLIGCLIIVVLLVIAAAFAGLFLRHVYDNWVNSDNTTTTARNPNAPAPQPVSATQYAQLVGSHATVLQADAQKIVQQCKNVVGNKAPCQSAVDAFHTDVAALQSDLNGVVAPPGLTKTDAKLRKSVNDGVSGSNNVSTGLNGHPVTLVKGLAQVGKAASELKEAEQQLNAVLGTTTTLAT